MLTRPLSPPQVRVDSEVNNKFAYVLDTVLPLSIEAAEQSSLEITPETEQKGHYCIKCSAKPIHRAAEGRCRGAEMSRFEHMPKAMPHTRRVCRAYRASNSFTCFTTQDTTEKQKVNQGIEETQTGHTHPHTFFHLRPLYFPYDLQENPFYSSNSFRVPNSSPYHTPQA